MANRRTDKTEAEGAKREPKKVRERAEQQPQQPEAAVVNEENVLVIAPPHIADLVAWPHVVHLTPRVKPRRPVVRVEARGLGSFVFRRGGDKPQLEHVINLTPAQARQLRGEGWTVTVKE